ncbi:MAG: YhgE/Pip domain-containing protein [Propionibacteriaceae bacterium]
MTATTQPGRGGPAARRWLLPVVAVLLTVLATGVLLWTVKGRQASGPAAPVAIVNSDKPVTTGSGKDAKTVAAGRELAGALSQPAASDQTPLSWQLVDEADAAKGLRDGSYYGVLTIPSNFSAAVTSTSGDKPIEAKLKLVSNDASSLGVAVMAQLAVDQAANTLGDQATSGYVDGMLQNITSIHTSLESSAQSADQLADSSDELATSAHKLAKSTLDLASSSQDLADSTEKLDTGSRELASGARTLASGADEAADGAADVATGASKLDTAAGKLENGAEKSAAGAKRVSSSAARVARGGADLAELTRAQSRRLDRLSTASGRVASGSDRVATAAQRAATGCPASAGIRYCAEVRRLAALTRVEARAVRGVDTGVTVAARRASRVADASGALSRADRALARGAKGVATGTSDVSDGVTALDRAAGSLSKGAASVASGTESVAGGADQTSAAAGQLASGADELTSGAEELASGASSLAGGADSLASGADSLASGAEKLASGLDNGAKSVPSYSDSQRKTLVSVVTTPVGVTATPQHQTTVSVGLIPVVLALALWLGTLMMFLTRGAVPTGPAWAQASPGRRVLIGWLPAVGVGVAQTAVLLVLAGVAGAKIASPVGLALFSVLGVLAFAATNQALVSIFGSFGRLVSLAFVVVEAAALGGLVPIETAPAFIQWLNGVLPLPQFVDGAGELLIGGSGHLVGACVVLVAWTLVSLAGSAVATARKRPALYVSPAVPPPRPVPVVATN